MNTRRQDFELLQGFVRRGDQAAFTDVVRRHLDLVFGTALRKVGDPGAAQEVAQNVFVALARKAWRFAPDDSLPAWLHKTALLESKSWLRGELRRHRREETAVELGTTMKTPDDQPAIAALTPLLDEALLSLREGDRTLLLLRYCENQSLRDVGAAFDVTEDTAQKRVQRALEKLSQFFQRRGFRTASLAATTAALKASGASVSTDIATAVVNAALQAAPPTLTGVAAIIASVVLLFRTHATALFVAAALMTIAWQWNHRQKMEREAAIAAANLQHEESTRLDALKLATASKFPKQTATSGNFASLDEMQSHQDVSAFFKQALSNPPEVESFEASMNILWVPFKIPKGLNLGNLVGTIQEFQGARAGSNWFLRCKTTELTTGSVAGEDYLVTSDLLRVESNGEWPGPAPSPGDRINHGDKSACGIPFQFLQMGLGELDAGTLTWKGDRFEGAYRDGRKIYGQLEYSNGLPQKLTAYFRTKAAPIFEIVYDYPQPPMALSGFPRAMTICMESADGFKPSLLLELSSVHLPASPLAAEFFRPEQFLTTDVIYTNLLTESTFTSISPTQTVTAPIDSFKR